MANSKCKENVCIHWRKENPLFLTDSLGMERRLSVPHRSLPVVCPCACMIHCVPVIWGLRGRSNVAYNLFCRFTSLPSVCVSTVLFVSIITLSLYDKIWWSTDFWISDRPVRLLQKTFWKGYGWKSPWSILRYLLSIFPKRLRITMNSVEIWLFSLMILEPASS